MKPLTKITRNKLLRCIFFICVGTQSLAINAAEFRSIAEPGTIMYDAPSAKSKKLIILGAGYPVEMVVNLNDWSKVRDAHGLIAWVENKSLVTKRTLLVQGSDIPVYEAPLETSAIVFHANEELLLDVVETGPAPWIKVRHHDGEIGYIQFNHVWGD